MRTLVIAALVGSSSALLIPSGSAARAPARTTRARAVAFSPANGTPQLPDENDGSACVMLDDASTDAWNEAMDLNGCVTCRPVRNAQRLSPAPCFLT